MTYVLDASAVLRLLFRQPGFNRVQVIFDQNRSARIVMCAVNWGEVIGSVDRLHGRSAALEVESTLRSQGLEIISATRERAERAALIKRDWKLGYADAFCVELATSFSGSVLIAADFEFRAVSALAEIEFLPDKLGRTSLP